MAEVFVARIADDRGPSRPLVVKRLPHAGDPQKEARFMAEARIALTMTHGNQVATFEVGRAEDGRPFLVMEYVDGQSLASLVERAGPLPEHLAYFVVREIARALAHAHDARGPDGAPAPVVHLDVSPDNVLIDRRGQVKLADFGIARAVGEASGEPVWGKPAYVAPERLDGVTTPAADVYGLGCVWQFALTGVPPRLGDSPADTLRMVHARVPVRLVGPPISLTTTGTLGWLLTDDAGLRPQDGRAVLRALSTHTDPAFLNVQDGDLAAFARAHMPAKYVPTDRERLALQMAAAGMDVAGASGTQDLLAQGTVPLGGEVNAAPAVSAQTWTAVLGDGAQAPAAPGGQRVGPHEAPDGGEGAGLPLTPNAPLRTPPTGAAVSPAHTESQAQKRPPLVALFALAAVPMLGAYLFWPGLRAGPETAVDAGATVKRPARDVDAGTPAARDAGAASKAAATSRKPRVRRTRPVRRPARTGAGTLRLNSFPYAVVYVDGKKVGTTPLRDVRVRAGKHTVRFVNPERKLTKTVRIRVTAGQTKTVGVRLDE